MTRLDLVLSIGNAFKFKLLKLILTSKLLILLLKELEGIVIRKNVCFIYFEMFFYFSNEEKS